MKDLAYLPDNTARLGWKQVQVVSVMGESATVKTIRHDPEGYGKVFTVHASILRNRMPKRRDWSHLRTEDEE